MRRPHPAGSDRPVANSVVRRRLRRSLRRSAFLEVGDFHERLGVGNEEQLLALDLGGLSLAYVPEVVARHDPHTSRDRLGRRRDVAGNALWIGWLRRPFSGALRALTGAAAASGERR